MIANRAEFVVAFMGIVKAGAIAITLHPKLSPSEGYGGSNEIQRNIVARMMLGL